MNKLDYLSLLHRQINTMRAQQIEAKKQRTDEYSSDTDIKNLQKRIDSQYELIESELTKNESKPSNDTEAVF